jgi:type II secretory pathway pseudopilin PulG
MKTSPDQRRNGALTLVEVLVIVAIFAVLFMMLLPPSHGGRARAGRIRCVINLKDIGLATRAWEGDHGDRYPWSIPGTNGGTMDFISGPNLWRHFQVMSNQLVDPKILICPADPDRRRKVATNFTLLSNSNLSYFIDLDSAEIDPQRILSGDCNITNGTPIKNGILELTTHNPPGWTAEMHDHVGNLLLSDGSVQQMSQTGLRSAVENTGTFTNRLQMPILGP